MNYKDIIQKSWEITRDSKKELFTFGFIPSFFGMIIGIVYVTYQVYAFSVSPLFLEKGEQPDFGYLDIVLNVWQIFADHPSVGVIAVFISFFVLLMYFFSPIICGGALIDLITKKANSRPLEGGFIKGLNSFFPLLEFGALTSPFGIVFYFSELFMILRNFGTGTWVIVIPVLTGILMLGLFLHLLFIFSEQFIVLEKLNVIQAIKRSTVLVLSNVKDTFFLGITLALISLRIVFNIFLILLIPFLVIVIIALMASLAMKWLGIILGLVIGFSLIFLGSYLMAGFTIFLYAVWTVSFMQFRKKEIENS